MNRLKSRSNPTHAGWQEQALPVQVAAGRFEKPRVLVKDREDDIALLREHHHFCLDNARMAQRSGLPKQQQSWEREARETAQLATAEVCRRVLTAEGHPSKFFAVNTGLLAPVRGPRWDWYPQPVEQISERIPPSALRACKTIREKGLPLWNPHVYYPEQETRLPDIFKRTLVESSKTAASHLTTAVTVTATATALAAVSILTAPVIAAAAVPTLILTTSDPVLCFVPRVPFEPGDYWIHLMVARWD